MNAGRSGWVSVNDCARVRIGLASPEDIRAWSFGEVTQGETVNYRTGRPVPGGLMCERIFGPEKDWECSCGKYRGLKYKGQTCERCGVEVTASRVRRRRMGHIELAAPVVHIWFFKVAPSCLGHLLDMTSAALQRLVYLQDYIVLDPGPTPLARGEFLAEQELRDARARYGDAFEADTGASAVARLLEDLDLAALARDLRGRLREEGRAARPSEERRRRLLRRLQVVEDLRASGNRPEWMVLRRLPVLPADLRPVVPLPSGGYASADLNDLYRRILHRNARLRKLEDLRAPDVILRNEKRLLQQAVDALFDNERSPQPVLGTGRRPLKSLADLLGGKQGRLRASLLGKRVDFSGRAVIVVGPELKLHQCGLPKKIAVELFQPFLIRRLREQGLATSIRSARELIRRRDRRLWDHLAEVMKGHPVLLNRAPTLHRMGIQAFEPVLVEGNAIRVHPLVCKGFNADFDGDQMAVHLPLSTQARVEAEVLLAPANNLFSPANGRPVLGPSQDVVLGCYHLTADPGKDGPRRVFSGPDEVVRAHAEHRLAVHDRIEVRLPRGTQLLREEAGDGEAHLVEAPPGRHGRVATTVGRVLFNDALPAALPFYDFTLTAAGLGRLIADAHGRLGRAGTVDLLDRVKQLGFREATRSGLSFAADDLVPPASKRSVLAAAGRAADRVAEQYERGNLTARERAHEVVRLWTEAAREVGRDLMRGLREDRRPGRPALNPIHAMVDSGARGSAEQVRQLAGLRGLMARPSGEIIETPIRASFREGLSVLEYFSSTHGARKGLADTALKTANSGHLTRRLVDVAQNVVVTMHDCGTPRGLLKKAGPRGAHLVGRVPAGTDRLITREEAARLAAGTGEAEVRSPLTCAAARGVCRLCYGADLSTGRLVELGTAVGVIAAQSIGEPATQLTLRTFHTGGAAVGGAAGESGGVRTQDITLGLPRVEELFEAQRPRRAAVLAEVSGVVRVGGPEEKRRGRPLVFVQPVDEEGRSVGDEYSHPLPAGCEPRVNTGDRVRVGDALTAGAPMLQDLLRTAGPDAVREYLLEEIQAVYRRQGIEVDDKHVEIVLAQMLRRVKVKSAGDTDLLPGAVVDREELAAANRRLEDCVKVKDAGASALAAGQLVGKKEFARERARLRAAGEALPVGVRPVPATAAPLVLGITRAALAAAGFLAAASFQETTRVLAAAALAGRVDELTGLKENVLLGRLIPAGTGYPASPAPG
jgi:DNA-directed RNA polymerase subunit beta'